MTAYKTYKKAKRYVRNLNITPFAGYNKWRLPTIDELITLLEKQKQSNGCYIDPMFSTSQWWCFSIDTVSLSSDPYTVGFSGMSNGRVHWNPTINNNKCYYVRAVRVYQQ